MRNISVAILGLGYVGHPLAINFGKILDTVGFDISKKKILNIKKKIDPTYVIKKKEFKKSKLKKTLN